MVTSGINVSMLSEEIKVDISSQIGVYFQQFGKEIEMLEARKKRWVQEATYSVKKQIKEGRLTISQQQQVLKF
jgi:hypothetical protein